MEGFYVHLDFIDTFDVQCLSGVNLAVSTIRLYRHNTPKGSQQTVVFCGRGEMKNVTVPDNFMWIRFQSANSNKSQKHIGFRARYMARGKEYNLQSKFR